MLYLLFLKLKWIYLNWKVVKIKKYTKRYVDKELGIRSNWSHDEKKDHIRKAFRYWNAKTNVFEGKELKHAEKMLNLCAAASEIYKKDLSPNKKKVKRARKKKKTINTKEDLRIAIDKDGNIVDEEGNTIKDDDDGCGCFLYFFILYVLVMILGC